MPFNAWSLYKTFGQGLISNTLTCWHEKGMNDVLPTQSWTIVCLFWVFSGQNHSRTYFPTFSILFFFLFNSKGREAPRGWSSISILPWHPHHEHFLYDTLILFLSSKLNYSDCTLRKLTLFKIMFQANQCTLSMRFNQVWTFNHNTLAALLN